MRERSTIRRGREVTRDRLNGNSERRTEGRGRTDGQRAKVGTSREGVSGSFTYVQIYSVLFIAPPPASLDHLKNQTGAAREREKGIENNGRSIPGAIGRRSLVGCQNQEQARITDESRRPIHKGKSERVFDAQVKRGREIGDREGEGE